jgi:hypothetical protein
MSRRIALSSDKGGKGLCTARGNGRHVSQITVSDHAVSGSTFAGANAWRLAQSAGFSTNSALRTVRVLPVPGSATLALCRLLALAN